MAADRAAGTRTARNENQASFTDILLGQGAAEDLAAYNAATLKQAARLAEAALSRHVPGESVIALDPLSGPSGPMTAVTVVNDNMPFLFDSVLGEVTETGGEPRLVLHPVLQLRHLGEAGVEILGAGHDATANKKKRDVGAAERVSLIHIHLPALDAAQAEALRNGLDRVLDQVRAAVVGWKPMLARLDQAITAYRYGEVPLEEESVKEAIAFLEWLRDDNFTFLGMREFRFEGDGETGTLTRTDAPGLGILRDPSVLVLRRDADGAASTPELRAFLHDPEPLIVTKANTKSLVHRRTYLDYVGVKIFDEAGRLAGELRIVGLFTSTAYTRSVFKIPFLRFKAEAVIAHSGFDRADHSGKALVNVLESYPRDELFQVSLPVLQDHAETIIKLGERPRLRVLLRYDQFDRFVSVIVFVPRDRYDSVIREKIGHYLKTVFDGRVSAYYPAFPDGGLARVHFIIGRSGGQTQVIEPATLEAGIRDLVRTWDDALRDAVGVSGAEPAHASLANRFPPAYRDSFTAGEALADAAVLSRLTSDQPIAIDFRRGEGEADAGASLKIFHLGEPVALSRRVPMLENLGFRVISERTFEVAAGDGTPVFIHDTELESAFGTAIDLSDGGELIEEAFGSVWHGRSDNDPFNALVQTARLPVAAIQVLRAYGRYLQQAGIPQSQDGVAGALNRYPVVAEGLWALFQARLDPARNQNREREARAIAEAIGSALDAVPSLDDDTILRRILALVEATLRTNFFAPPVRGTCFAVKLDSRALSFLPEPKPWREIFVHGAEVEGVHLRFGPVARGGLRWSDRPQDYRTEVLGLVKAQQVKNAVIVPVGAKGGFFPKRLPAGGDRNAVFQEGKAAYVRFVSSLLSLTDNIEGDHVSPPADTVRHDGDDPYFVVAADKGTATFSDTANAIAQAHGFWLDDAFASGGSVGYDHKKMGITARGAWEAVKRHFREADRDIQTEPFTVAGIGDMSGDVFGNGMLLSPEIRLVAAFDHRDIFLDPDPDPAASLVERQRLFDLPRSSWQDYDKAKLSPGGMIVSRSEKSVTLDGRMAAVLGVAEGAHPPAALMKAILKAPVDLLWFGGIGTYVKASGESHLDAGDRANDTIRVSAPEVRAKVIGEGANLAVTQKGRIEYGLAGGRCNSDAIDNSAGVNSSDVEVNIKIALSTAMRAEKLTRIERDALLPSMTAAVAGLVLRNNYDQTLALSMLEQKGASETPHLARLMANFEARGLLDRAVEALPAPDVLAERQARGQGLTRAELGVLLAYAKIVLFSDLVDGPVPDDAAFNDDLLGYFPPAMQEGFREEIEAHRLRRPIITRVLVNDLVNRGGPAFVLRLSEATGASVADVALSFAAARDGFDLNGLYGAIDHLDNRVRGQAQLGLYAEVNSLLEQLCAWLLRNGQGDTDVTTRIAAFSDARAQLEPLWASVLPRFMAARAAERAAGFVTAGVPDALARRLSLLDALALVPDILAVAQEGRTDLPTAAKAFFGITEAFRIGRIEDAARGLAVPDYFDALARDRAVVAIDTARRRLSVAALATAPDGGDPAASWLESDAVRLQAARDRLQALTEGGDLSLSRLSVAAGLMTDLASASVRS